MISTVPLADLAARVDIAAHEAVAIAQQLIAAPASEAELVPPLGPPSTDNVLLHPDGHVICVGSASTPAVSEIGALLWALMPHRSEVRVPGGLRYTIARALLDVDAPPFDSIHELASALARYERGDRCDVLCELYVRFAAARAAVPALVGADRRRPSTPPAELRRYLREMDEELFLLRNAPPPVTVRVPVPIAASDPPAQPGPARSWIAGGAVAAMCSFAAGYAVTTRVHRVGTAPEASAPQVSTARPVAALEPETPAATATATPAVQELSAPRPSAAPASAPPQERSAARSVSSPGTGTRVANASLVRAAEPVRGPMFSPAFASNGSALFFHTGRSGDTRSALASADLSHDLEVMTIVDDGARNYHVQPSPDGTQVAFDSDRDGQRGVYVANRDGSNVRRISGDGFAAVPTWSPDSGRLAFIRGETDRPHVWNLWLQTLSTGETRRLTAFRYGQTWSASWFGDGRRVAYTHEDRLAILDLATGATREFASPIAKRLLRTPAVSPDGKHIVFQVARSGAWLLDVADGSMRCVLTDPTAEEFAWSPDGRRVAFHSRRDGQWGIWVMVTDQT